MHFQELQVWIQSKSLVNQVFEITKYDNFNNDFYLKNHIRKTAVSIISNISEGFGRDGNKELIQFLYIAKGSTRELQSQLIIAADQGLISEVYKVQLIDRCETVLKLLHGFIKYLKNSNFKGSKYV